MSQDEKDNPFPKEPVRGPYHSWPRMTQGHFNTIPVPDSEKEPVRRDYKLEHSEQYGLVVPEDEVEAYSKLGFIPVPGPEFHPSTETLEELGQIIKDRAGYLLAEYEFQKFVADR